jgi:hypothetical protein
VAHDDLALASAPAPPARRPPHGMAINDAATRAALSRYRLAAWGWLALGLVLVGSAVLIDGIAPPRVGGWLGGLSICMFVGAAVMLRRVRRWRNLLSERAWRPFRARHLRLKPNRASAGLVLTPADGSSASPEVLKLDAVSWRQDRLDNDSVVWLCGDPCSGVIVTSPRARQLFAASPPHGYVGRRFMKAHSDELASLGVTRSRAVRPVQPRG